MALSLGELVAIISADDSRFRRVMGGVHGALQRVGKLGALAALAGSATHLAVALAPAAGALAVMPGLLIAVKVSTLALSMALAGVGDAFGALVTGDMNAYQDALKKMPAAAQQVVRNLAPIFQGLQKRTQAAFFAPMRKASQNLGRDLREPVGRGMATIGAAFGKVGAKLLGVGRDAKTLAFIPALAKAIASGIGHAGSGVKPLVRGIRDFAGASLGAFARLGKGAGSTMSKIGGWLSSKAEAGKPMQWITSGIERLKALGRIARNVGSSLKNIFKNAGAGQSGTLLASIEKITARLKEWSASAEGQAKIQTVFRAINQVASDLVVILPMLGGALALVASIIKALPTPAQGAVSKFLALSLVVGLVAGRLGPLVRGIALLMSGLGKIASVLRLGAALTWLGGKLKLAAAAAGRFAKSMVMAMGRAAAAAWGAAVKVVAAAGRMAASMVAAMGRIAAAAGRAALSMLAASGRMAMAAGRAAIAVVAAGTRMAVAAAAAAVRVVAGWVLMGTQAMLQAARMALAWVIAMGPVGWIVAAAIAAVALIIANWDKVKKFFVETLPRLLRQGFTFIVGIIKTGARVGFFGPVGLIIAHWGKIKNFFTVTIPAALRRFAALAVSVIKRAAQLGFLGPIGLIIAHWTRIKNFFTSTLPTAVRNGITRVTGFVRSLPGRIRSAVGNLGSLLAGAGRNVINGLINGIRSRIASLGNVMSSIAGKIRSYLPFSPAKTGPLSGRGNPARSGRSIVTMLAAGMSSRMPVLARTMGLVAARARLDPALGAGTLSPARSSGAAARSHLAAASAGGEVRVTLDTRGADAEMLRLLRKIVRVTGGGNVQVALGGS